MEKTEGSLMSKKAPSRARTRRLLGSLTFGARQSLGLVELRGLVELSSICRLLLTIKALPHESTRRGDTGRETTCAQKQEWLSG